MIGYFLQPIFGMQGIYPERFSLKTQRVLSEGSNLSYFFINI
jgi:hypothetical protein